MTKEVVSARQPQSPSLLSQTRAWLRRYHLPAKKSLGQHFLIDEDVLNLVVATAAIGETDVVVEVGPGLGVLTRELARRAGRVIAVELDSNLADILREALADCRNVTIVNDNVLDVAPAALLGEPPPQYKVVANLPYYITSPVLRHFLETPLPPRMLVVMVQKEVAAVIAAEPGDMSLLSVSVQFYGKPTIIRTVPAAAFHPQPEVESAIIRIDVYAEPPVPVTDTEGFFKLVRAGFSAPRKQIHNALMHRLCLPKDDVSSLLARAGIMPQRRAQTLSLDEWARLWQVYSGAGKPTC